MRRPPHRLLLQASVMAIKTGEDICIFSTRRCTSFSRVKAHDLKVFFASSWTAMLSVYIISPPRSLLTMSSEVSGKMARGRTKRVIIIMLTVLHNFSPNLREMMMALFTYNFVLAPLDLPKQQLPDAD